MKLADSALLSVALALIIIGIHQSWTSGVGGSYFIFMFAVGMLFWFQLRRNKARTQAKVLPQKPKQKKKN